MNALLDLEKLNPEQRLAVETTEGPVLVLSGAGTGKTTVLTSRLAYIIQNQKALPFQCLAVTFTNKAAREMKERLANMIGPEAQSFWLGTFHSIGLRILKNHPEKVGLSAGFSVLDSSDQERLLKQIMVDRTIDLKENPVRMVLSEIQRLKDLGLTPENAHKTARPATALVRGLYVAYQERLKAMNAADFGDLLMYCIVLFQSYPQVLNAFRSQFKYILVDEYQDTNAVQYLWLRLLSGGHSNICCVGDDDQSIYSWRGAEIGNILRFEEDFPQAKTIRLETNYRSTAHILAGASGLIAHNRTRLGKTLRPASNSEEYKGEKINITTLYNADEEAKKICEYIEKEQRKGTSLADIAVLVRASFQTRAIEDQLLYFGISYKIIAGMRFYEREEIRDVTAYIRLLVQPKDDMAFIRIVNKPRRGIGETSLNLIRQKAMEEQLSLSEAAQILLQEKALKGTSKTGLTKFFELYDSWRQKMNEMLADDLLQIMLEESGYMELRRTDKTPEKDGRIENIRELIGEIKNRFETFEDYLEYVSLVMDNDTGTGDFVSVMTLHAAKGLEYDAVFLPGWEENIFPHKKSLDEGGDKSLEEERRLAYVGITRAKKRVYISNAISRYQYGEYQYNPESRFISEIPAENINIEKKASYNQQNSGYFGYEKSYTSTGFFGKNNTTLKNKQYSYSSSPVQSGFKVNDEVYHSSFGYGKVLGISGKSVEVFFDGGNIKKIMSDFLEKI